MAVAITKTVLKNMIILMYESKKKKISRRSENVEISIQFLSAVLQPG